MLDSALLRFDQSRRGNGINLIAGVDEAGRGPWAGPVAAAAVILKPNAHLEKLNDSKKLTPEIRSELYSQILDDSLAYSVALIPPHIVDSINILQATYKAMRQALSQLTVVPDLVLVDGNRPIPGCPHPQKTIVKGDALSAAIAAASILAKVTRDKVMDEAHLKYPQYKFNRNKGYGTSEHQQALRRHGPCEIHRRSYSPVIDALSALLPFDHLTRS